jgi:hypothetical protein
MRCEKERKRGHESKGCAFAHPSDVYASGSHRSEAHYGKRNGYFTKKNESAKPPGNGAIDHQGHYPDAEQQSVRDRVDYLSERRPLIKATSDVSVDPICRSDRGKQNRRTASIRLGKQEPEKHRNAAQPNNRNHVRNGQNPVVSRAHRRRAYDSGRGVRFRPLMEPYPEREPSGSTRRVHGTGARGLDGSDHLGVFTNFAPIAEGSFVGMQQPVSAVARNQMKVKVELRLVGGCTIVVEEVESRGPHSFGDLLSDDPGRSEQMPGHVVG